MYIYFILLIYFFFLDLILHIMIDVYMNVDLNWVRHKYEQFCFHKNQGGIHLIKYQQMKRYIVTIF